MIPSLAWASIFMLVFGSAAAAQEPPSCAVSSSERDVNVPTSAQSALAEANREARYGPANARFSGARQIYPYAPGSIFELNANPAYVSAILLEPGEALAQVGAGDTERWLISEAEGEAEEAGRAIVLVKPKTNGLRTNIVLVTTRRIYLIEASSRTGEVYAAEISWCYPANEGSAEINPSLEALNLAYRVRVVRGRRPSWTPLRVFDDGRRTFIDFPEATSAGELPPLFVIGPGGTELVNYRVIGQRYIVDRLFDRAELRLGRSANVIVRIDRGEDAPRAHRRGRP